ncbi:hypothetical protein J4446_02845 [Candidatus Woesearchaeota archaeon]|nr:hypothetical protein [Candidatus Woesearchaeota archaeon]
MGDIVSDHEAAIRLVIGAYRRLQAHNPQHELLKYITNVTDEGFDNVEERCEQYLDRFETPEDKKKDYVMIGKVLCSYFIALRNASEEIEGIRKPQPLEKLIDEDGEDLPF